MTGEAEPRLVTRAPRCTWSRAILARAEAEHQTALAIALQIGSSWDQAFALAGLGRCAIAAGRADEGKRGLKRARDLFERADPRVRDADRR